MKSCCSVSALFASCGVLVMLAGLLGGGCSLPLPQAQGDPTKFFVLSSEGAMSATPALTTAPALRLRPIEIASYLHGRPMVVRRGENEIQFQEYARWGEPLEQGIARVLRQELLARGATSAVQIGSVRPSDVIDAKYDLTVRILACEGLANGGVAFHATWELSSTGDNPAVIAHGDFRAGNLHWTPRNDATLAAALSRGVAELAAEIAAGIPKG